MAFRSVSGFKLVIEGADGNTVSTLTGSYPSKVLSNPQIPHTQTLQVIMHAGAAGLVLSLFRYHTVFLHKSWPVHACLTACNSVFAGNLCCEEGLTGI